ncbi:MAG: hypothetical protein HYY44_03825, partial [Deltaproteobacteria bacterium]|nr:hypothetical protein [Deltaproteobacteria bacterium]
MCRDNDGDGYPNRIDFPGELTRIPVYETWMLPANLTIDTLTLNLQLEFYRENDRLKVRLLNIPRAEGGGEIVEVPAGADLIRLECSRGESHTYFDGEAGRYDDACPGLASVNTYVSDSGRDANCFNQNLDNQFRSTLEEMLTRQIPFALNEAISESAETRLSQVALPMFDKKLALDLYADLSRSDIRVSPIGLFLKLNGLLAPAGLTEADASDDDVERLNAFEFFRNTLGPGFSDRSLTASHFGPIREVESPEPVDPAEEASHLGSELNLALGEEFVNSLLHAANTLLDQLSLERPDFMDLSVTKLREMGMAAPDIGGSDCLDENGMNVQGDRLGADGADDPTNNWKCFPFNLDLATILGEGAIAGLPGDTPLVIRTKLNPNAPLTARIVNVGTIATPPDETGSTRPSMITAELEIGMRDGEMQIFEGQFVDTGIRKANHKKTERKIEVKDWCERQPLADPRCAEPNHDDLPMVTFKTNGRLSISLTFLIDEGLLTITGGITGRSVSQSAELTEESTSYATPTTWEVDRNRTYLNFSVKENHTLARDQDDTTIATNKGIVTTFQEQIIGLLNNYLAETPTSIWVDVPLKAPLSEFCSVHPEVREICDCVGDRKGQTCHASSAVDDLLEEMEPYNLFGIEINDLLREWGVPWRLNMNFNVRPLFQYIPWLAAALMAAACGDDDSTPEKPHFRQTEPKPDNQLADRNCRFTETTYADEVKFSEPFRNFPNSPAQPINICAKQALDRNQLAFRAEASGQTYDLSGIVKWASFPRLLEEKNWSAICRESSANFADCQKVLRYTNPRAEGRDLYQQTYELANSGDVGNWGITFVDQLHLLQSSEAEAIGPHAHAIGLAEFLETDPTEPPVANLTFDLESAVAGFDGYLPSSGKYLLAGYRRTGTPENPDPNDCLPTAGKEVELADGTVVTFPFYEDEIP